MYRMIVPCLNLECELGVIRSGARKQYKGSA